MQSKKLSSTGITIPEIGIGTWCYQGGVLPLLAGIEQGAHFIDTAESYGTEELIGGVIRGIRHKVFLASKVLPRHFRWADVIRAADNSLRRLRTDYLDLYQLHWPNHTVPIEETMSAMEELVDQGKIRFIGVSNFWLCDLRNAQKAMRKYKIVSDQIRYNLIDRSVDHDLLPYCREQNITIIAHSPLANDLSCLTANDPDRVLEKIANRVNKTVAQIALNWCIAHDGLITIPKSNSAEHVKENCQASDWRLSVEDRRLLEQRVRFHRRGAAEIKLRCTARHVLQLLGREL
jgi:diketogulonate reductase-like aldo/keto reductase